MSAIAVIPARLGSTRLPAKIMADLGGKPLLWHVWSQARQARSIQRVVIATDTPQVQEAVSAWGGEAILTSPDCRSGTERIASIISQLAGDFILNVQGDEPMIDPALLDRMAALWREAPCDILTPVYRIRQAEELWNPNIVKVARAYDGRALYFSRNAVPYLRDQPEERWLDFQAYWGHIGVYGYRRGVLENYAQMAESGLEAAERLEQLRFMEAGYTIQTFESDYQPVSVDTPEDLERVRQLMAMPEPENPKGKEG